jgi:hypothetical protein
MIRILYSADYELYLGENFLPEPEVVVEPTRALLAAAERIDVPFTLFVDVACLWRYREDDDHEFPDEVETQLKGALQRGHDVQAHLHPQWLHAERIEGRWQAPLDTFLVGALDDPAPLLARAKVYLEELLCPVDPDYRCIAFRAGNYGLQPDYKRVFAALDETGYEIDSSVVPGLVLKNEVNKIDFRGWRWPEKGRQIYDIYEVPVATARFGPPDAVQRYWTRPPRREPRGRTIQSASGARRPSLFSRVFRLDPLELGPSAYRLQKITRRYLRRAGKDADFSFSSHPKAVGEPELEALVAYHAWLDRHYDVEAVTFRELAARLAAEPAE